MGDERDQIRERLPIETLVGERVALTRAGRNLKGLCPFHKENSPSFVVSPERGSFHCFGCGASGDIFRFLMLTDKVEFPDALRSLAARTGVEVDPGAAARKAVASRAHEVLAAVTLYFQQALMGEAGTAARAYLSGRGLTRATWERFALGYMPDWGEGLRRALPERGVSEQELIEAGVLIPSEQGREPFCAFHGRLIFPIRDAQGHVCGFGGRILGEGQPKYLNSRQSALFDKSATLYTIDRAAEAIRATGEAVLVEGYMDALRAHQEGFGNVVASLGTAITVRHLTILAKLTSRVVLALDADPAGARAAAEAGVRATIALRQERAGAAAPGGGLVISPLGRHGRTPLDLRIATLPDGRDPDEVIATDRDTWRTAIAAATPAMDHLFDLVLSSLDRASPRFAQDLISQMLPLIGELPGVGLQQPYLERMATLTRIDTATLRGELGRLRGGGGRQAAVGAQSADRVRGGIRGRAELAALREVTPQRDPKMMIEEELIRFLLRQAPLPQAALDGLRQASLVGPERAALLALVIDAHRQGARPDAATILAALPEELHDLGDRLRDGPPLPPVENSKVAPAVRTIVLRLERLAQGDRLHEQGQLLDQVDSETARTLLASMQDLVASRNEVTQRLMEEQAHYHMG